MVQYLVLGLVAVTALIVFINLIKGLIRGFKKTLGSLVAIIASAVIAFIVTVIICKPSSSLVTYLINLLGGVLNEETTQILFGIESVGEVLNYYVVLLIAPFVFVAIYAVLSIILAIVASIVTKHIAKNKKLKPAANRLGGLGVGVLCGLLVSVILLTPLVGIIGSAAEIGKSESVSDLADVDLGGEKLSDLLHDLSEDEVMNVYYSCCGWIFDALTTTDFQGDSTTLKSELAALIDIVANFSALSSDEGFGQEQIDSLNAVIDDLDKSPLVKHAAAGLVSEMAGSWVAGESFMGMEKIEAGELLDPIIDSVLEVLATTDKSNIIPDMHTLTGILGIFVNHNMLENSGDVDELIQTLGKDKVVGELIKEVNKNPRMSVISDSIAQLSVRALASTIGIMKDPADRYDHLMDDTAKILNESINMSYDERYEYVDRHLITTLDDYGVEVSDEATLSITESILTDLGSISDLEGEDVEEFFIVYAAAYETSDLDAGSAFELLANKVGGFEVDPDNGTISVNGRTLKNYRASNYGDSAAFKMGREHVDFEDARTLYSAESMKSSLITMSDIMAGIKKFSDCDDPDAEAEKINEMLAEAVEIFGSDFSNMKKSELFDNMGALLDKMHATEIFGAEVTEGVLKAVVQSESVRGEIGLTNKEASNFADKLSSTSKTENGSYGNTTQAVSNTIEVVDKINDSSTTREERRESTEKLITNMSPDNAELLGTMTTPSMMVKYGSTESAAQVVSDSVSTLLNNMAAFQDKASSDTVYDTEADAVNTLLVIAMDSAVSESDSLFSSGEGDEGRTGTTASEYVELFVSSDVVSETLITTVYEEGNGDNPFGVKPSENDKVEFSNAINEYYENNSEGLSEEEHDLLIKKLNAVAIITNMELPFAEQ